MDQFFFRMRVSFLSKCLNLFFNKAFFVPVPESIFIYNVVCIFANSALTQSVRSLIGGWAYREDFP